MSASKVLRLVTGDRVRLRKPHPCGSDEWEIVRAGMDVRARCVKCQREVRLPRARFERQVKNFTRRAGEGSDCA